MRPRVSSRYIKRKYDYLLKKPPIPLKKTHSRSLRRAYAAYLPVSGINIEKLMLFILVLVVAICITIVINILFNKKINIPVERVSALQIPYNAMPELKTLSDKYRMNFPELVLYYLLENEFFPTKKIMQSNYEIEKKYLINFEQQKKKYARKNIDPYYTLIKNILDDLLYFPIASGYDGDISISYMYGDSWGAEKTACGEKAHTGTDITDRENVNGRIPVVSMSDGTIKDLGWTENGGYRIGVLTDSGTYIYYAHLNKYADNLVQGYRVKAGQLLGYMGNSGYGKKEGKWGNYQVHLHIGISPSTTLTSKEFWINPYPFLRFIEQNKIDVIS